MLVIGSFALQAIAPELLDRTPQDIDLVGTYDEMMHYARDATVKYPLSSNKYRIEFPARNCVYDFEIAWPGSTAEDLIRIVKADKKSFTTGAKENYFYYPSLDTLFMLKASQRFRRNSPHFYKTMRDWRVMRAAGAKIPVEYMDFYKRREKETLAHKHPKLNVSKSSFFSGDGVKYVYDHDTIHLAVKHLDQPAYTYFKPENSEVLCDRKMFEAADQQTRLYSVLEEAYVLALERSQIPHPGVVSARKSFDTALMKVCTSITSGWWREFAYEHFHEVEVLYSDDYLTRFHAGVQSKLVKKL